jgi:hypothetical protein
LLLAFRLVLFRSGKSGTIAHMRAVKKKIVSEA